MLSLTALLIPSTLASPSQRVLRARDGDQSNLIAPTDYDVVSGIFAQSSGQSVDVVRVLCNVNPDSTVRSGGELRLAQRRLERLPQPDQRFERQCVRPLPPTQPLTR